MVKSHMEAITVIKVEAHACKNPYYRDARNWKTYHFRLQKEGSDNIFDEFAGTQDVYFKGKLEAGIALTGQVAGRISDIKPIQQIFDETLKEFGEVTGRLAKLNV